MSSIKCRVFYFNFFIVISSVKEITDVLSLKRNFELWDSLKANLSYASAGSNVAASRGKVFLQNVALNVSFGFCRNCTKLNNSFGPGQFYDQLLKNRE